MVAPPGWYPHPLTGRPAWWDGTGWGPSAPPPPPAALAAQAPPAHLPAAPPVPATPGPPPVPDTSAYQAAPQAAPHTTPTARPTLTMPTGPPPPFRLGPPEALQVGPHPPYGDAPAAIPPTGPTAAPPPPPPGRRAPVGLVLVALLVTVALVSASVGAAAVLLGGPRPPGVTDLVPPLAPRPDAASPVDAAGVVAEIEAFWSAQDVPGLDYRPIDPDAVTDDPRAAARCGGERNTDETLQGNAFYCLPDDYVYYDPAFLRELSTDVGPLVPALVLAHEWGHRIQRLSDTLPDTSLLTELQADCYAAAWARHVVDEDRPVPRSDDPLLELYRTSVLIGDQHETLPGDDQAHGTGFDRAGAIFLGWDAGVAACVDLPRNPPATVQGSTSPLLGGSGNLPLDQLVPVGLDMLNASFPGADVPATAVRSDGCGTADPTTRDCGDGTINVDRSQLGVLYSRYGDMAAWVPFIRAYLDSRGAPPGPGRHHDCGVGALAASMLDGLPSPAAGTTVGLSGGDLDEILLQLSVDTTGQEAFDRIGEVRRGFEGGWRVCS